MDSTNSGLQRVFSNRGWESVDAEGQLHALFCVILYKGLEHPWILVSGGFLEPVLDTTHKFLRNQKLYMDFQLHGRTARGFSAPTPAVFKGQLYICANVYVCLCYPLLPSKLL